MFGEEPAAEPDPPGGGLFDFLRRLSPIRFSSGPPPGTRPTGEAAAPAWPEPAEGETLDLEKAWYPLHFLFTGSTDAVALPAGFLTSGGEDVGVDRWGDPVARLLAPGQVREVATFLGALSQEELARRFDPARVTGSDVHRHEVQARPEEAAAEFQYLLDTFVELRTFMDAAADAGDAVVVHVG